jgi:hypothetical protein
VARVNTSPVRTRLTSDAPSPSVPRKSRPISSTPL